mmetsp:Transcript_6997/g.6650  ORF Transcript_6997/g.6650 Transcript_6997/m.6650 type:complete len:86 (-) Transcript_6997:259-516(-)
MIKMHQDAGQRIGSAGQLGQPLLVLAPYPTSETSSKLSGGGHLDAGTNGQRFPSTQRIPTSCGSHVPWRSAGPPFDEKSTMMVLI